MNDALKELTAKWGGPAAGVVLFLGGLGLIVIVVFVPMPEARSTLLFTQGMAALTTGLGILGILAQNSRQLKKLDATEAKVDTAVALVADNTKVTAEAATAAGVDAEAARQAVVKAEQAVADTAAARREGF